MQLKFVNMYFVCQKNLCWPLTVFDFIIAKMLSSLIDSMHDIIILTIILQKSSHFFQIMTISKNVVLIIETKTVFSVMMYYWNVLIG